MPAGWAAACALLCAPPLQGTNEIMRVVIHRELDKLQGGT